MSSPLAPILERQPFAVLDGGLATELERRGADLLDPLWSARVLIDRPDAIRALHLDYLVAGADLITTASYQATIPGLVGRGMTATGAEEVLRGSVALALDARAEFLASEAGPDRPAPLVAASIGPYGAYLHDGSEYRGDYGRTTRELERFHRDRFELLAATEADLLACETVPSIREAEALVNLLERRGGRRAWISFTGKDPQRIADGTPFAEACALVSASDWVALVGLNCTPPELIAPLLESAGGRSRRPFVVYPNSGEVYQAGTGTWHGEGHPDRIPRLAERWHGLGARLIGGCCRTDPGTIRELRAVFAPPASDEERPEAQRSTRSR
jgi:homocysteine S-methyltransferase